QAERPQEDLAEFGGEDLAGGGAGGIEDHGRGSVSLWQIGEAYRCDKDTLPAGFANPAPAGRPARVAHATTAAPHLETFMSQYDVLCIGNAIVDIIAQCDDAFLSENGIIKGAMNLIDAERANLLYSRMGPATEASGGCAGNTAAGIASLGGRTAFFGKVADDELGRIYAHDIHAQGVAFDTRPLNGTPPTARSMIFVTPDGERSMNTYLGACVELGPEDVEADKAAGAKVTYFEGYLWDPPRAKEAIRLTAD